MTRPILVYLGFVLAGAHVVLAATVPVPVSPGSAERVVPVEARCPTFSWSATGGARGYELIVYRIGDDGEESRPVLKQRFRGAVDGWTPSLDQCLDRGGQYAWSVRAVGVEEDGK